MTTIRVLHIASFLGNIGDNINHLGLYNRLENHLPWKCEVTQLEMREFFRKERAWDQALAEYINSFDVCVIGGGNYFELWVEESPTGTSVGLSPELLSRITTPIVFHALGCDDGMGAPPSTVKKFAEFIDYTQEHPNQFLISLRNDGSLQTFREKLGQHRASRVLECPDCGFFYTSARGRPPGSRREIGINIAGDMLEQRFGDEERYRTFVRQWAQLLATVAMEHESGVVFFCHIFKDLGIVSELVNKMPDRVARELVRVAPYHQGSAGAQQVFGEYHACSLILANRFHANVYPLANGIPVIPLINYPQIERLYRDFDPVSPTIALTSEAIPSATATINRALKGGLEELKAQQSNAMVRIRQQGDRYFSAFESWLKRALEKRPKLSSSLRKD